MLHIEIATPEKLMYRGEASEVRVPALQGQLGVLPGHVPLLSTLGVGPLVCILPSGEQQVFAAAHGFLEVLDDKITVLASVCEKAEDINLSRAETAYKRAQEAMLNLKLLQTTASHEAQEKEAAVLRERAEQDVAISLQEESFNKLSAKLQRAMNRVHVAALKRQGS